MRVRRGDIWWVDFGTPKGSEQGGKRPALIIQNNTGNACSSTTIIAALTSKNKGSYPFHVDISASESGLSQDGTVLTEQLRTISQDRLINLIGSLSPIKMKEIDQALQVSLGIISP
ncbi:MAG: type II toxin-antitoxin system PemK/MazF family toxin [Deltaproteobacteria bacterium]